MSSSPLLEWCRGQMTQAVALLEDLVGIDSGPDSPGGWEEVAAVAIRELSSLGLSTTVERVGGDSPVVIARCFSQRRSRRILVLAHLDTVFPQGTAAERPFSVTNGKAIGPGVADMKGGFVTLLLALRCLSDNGGLDGYAITVLVNCDEEIGSMHSRSIIEREAAEADVALSFEPARPDGSLVTTRRGHRRYRLEVSGRAAHTGVDPGLGANAIVTLARWIAAVELCRPEFPEGTSVTVSLVEGGTSINTVPDRAVASIDVRIHDSPSADRVEEILRGVAIESEPGTSYRLVQFVARPPMDKVPGVESVIAVIADAGRQIGIEVSFTATGGSSDAGIAASVGVPSVDGLGPVGGGYHTSSEFINLATVAERAALAAATIRRLGDS